MAGWSWTFSRSKHLDCSGRLSESRSRSVGRFRRSISPRLHLPPVGSVGHPKGSRPWLGFIYWAVLRLIPSQMIRFERLWLNGCCEWVCLWGLDPEISTYVTSESQSCSSKKSFYCLCFQVELFSVWSVFRVCSWEIDADVIWARHGFEVK